MNIGYSVFLIVIGLIVWRLIPKCIKYGKKKTRQKIQFWSNIFGLIMMLAGIISLVRFLTSWF